MAYDTAAYMLRGEYAHLNFPDLKHQLKANSLNGTSSTTASLLVAKLQAISQGINNNNSSSTHNNKTIIKGIDRHHHHDQSSSPSSTSPKKKYFSDHHQNLKVNNGGLVQNPMRKERQFGFMESKLGAQEMLVENNNIIKNQDVVAPDVEAVQLSRMPSLDMDVIWDALLVSDAW